MPVKMSRLESKKNKKNNAFYLCQFMYKTRFNFIFNHKKRDFIHDISCQQRHFFVFHSLEKCCYNGCESQASRREIVLWDNKMSKSR